MVRGLRVPRLSGMGRLGLLAGVWIDLLVGFSHLSADRALCLALAALAAALPVCNGGSSRHLYMVAGNVMAGVEHYVGGKVDGLHAQ